MMQNTHAMILLSLIPPYKFAGWLLDAISRLLAWLHIDHSALPQELLYILTVILIALGSGWLVQKLVVFLAAKVINVHFPQLGSELRQQKVLTRCGRIIPPLIFLCLIPFAFDGHEHTTHVILIIAVALTIVTTVIAVNSILGFWWIHYNTHRNTRNLPLKGIFDICRGAMWVVAVIVIISMILGKSPAALLTGLGAFAAVLLLVFRNSILGLVAGVQLSDNDMLRVGDWISVPGSDANGIVIDVSLVVVKIRNWNNTVTMLPPYQLISKPFINWRCMKDTGSRQIEQSVLIDVNTVRPLSDDELHTIQQQVPALKDFIDVKLSQRAAGHTANVFNKEAGVNGTIDTNLGLFRAYVNLYIERHPWVNLDRMHMVRILQPGPYGFPLQIFCYLTTADWPAYESIMADIFEHIAAIAPTFGLAVFESPSGRSVFNIASQQPAGEPYYGTAPLYTPTPDPTTNKMPAD